MRRYSDEEKYLACPNTAVALAAADRWASGTAGRTLVMATAHPCKFEESVTAAMGTAKWAEIAEEIPQVKSIMARRAGEVQEFMSQGDEAANCAAWEQQLRALVDRRSRL